MQFRSSNAVRGCGIALWLLSLASPAWVRAHDLATIALLSPRSGCALGSAETVVIRNVNYGTAMPPGSFFDMSFTINNGTPLVQPVFMGNGIPPNGTTTFTFPPTATADLSAPGDYLIDASMTVPGDTNNANNALGAQLVRNWAPSVGGSASAPVAPASAGTIGLSGQTGTVVEWQQSLDGLRWRALENTGSTQSFANLAATTYFRALVQNGLCPPALSDVAVVSPINIFANGFEP